MHYSPVRRSPSGPKPHAAARLACVKRAASVQSEPGSNSSVRDLICLALRLLHGCGNAKKTPPHSARFTDADFWSKSAPAHTGCVKIIKEHSPNSGGKKIILHISPFLQFFLNKLKIMTKKSSTRPSAAYFSTKTATISRPARAKSARRTAAAGISANFLSSSKPANRRIRRCWNN